MKSTYPPPPLLDVSAVMINVELCSTQAYINIQLYTGLGGEFSMEPTIIRETSVQSPESRVNMTVVQ